MKKHLAAVLALVMALALCTSAWAEDADKSWYSDTGTSFTISDAGDLLGLASLVNSGKDFSGKTITLSSDIDLNGVTWAAIGNGTRSGSNYSGNAFKGTFNGGGKTISGVSSMLFGILDGGTIKNLEVEANIDVTGDAAAVVGVVAGGGKVDNITVSGSVKGTEAVGGVVGRVLIEGSVTNCSNSATITSTDNEKAGGIVGIAYYTAEGKTMTISGCKNSGAVTSGYVAGGIVGFSAADVKNCSNSAAIAAGTEAGGIVGEQVNRGTVSGNTNTGTVSNTDASSGTAYGGIIGWIRYQVSITNYPTAANALIEVSGNNNSGTISASGASLGVGGIVGSVYNQATVTGNTNTASTIVGGTFAAGIVGEPQKEEKGNVVMGNETIAVSNNVSTTALDNITGNCRDLYAYLNDTSFVATGNTDTIPTTNTGTTYYYYSGDKTDEKIEAPKTFDAGIAMYVGMAVMSVTGMAYVGKKKF